jgi:hypothetical protein
MNKKIILFITLSTLLLLIGTPFLRNQNWKQFSEKKETQPQSLSGVINNVKTFNGQEEIFLQQLIADSACVLFRFPSQTCSCLEPEFTEGLKRVVEAMGENKVLTVIAAENTKEIFFFRERNRLSYPIYSAADTVFSLYEAAKTPYACIVYPDMSAQHIVSVNTENINKLIAHAKETFR